MIEFINVSKRFGHLMALKQVNLELSMGKSYALIGPNGCGKSTLIKSLLGLVKPSEGQIIVDSENILNSNDYRNAIGYMPQIGRYPDNMSIGQVLEMIISLRSNVNVIDKDLIHEYKLDAISHKKMSSLSGGTRQKVSAALAFLFNPKILILDEPTAGLDPIASEILKTKVLCERSKGKLIVITSHLLQELDNLVSDIVFLHEGSIRINSSSEQLKNDIGQQQLSKAIAQILISTQHE